MVRSDGNAVSDGEDGATGRPGQFEWVCQKCGRGHPRRSPPCSRCGHATLEKEPIRNDFDEVEPASYLQLGKFHITVAVVLVAFAVLAATGALSMPQHDGEPSIDDAPGSEQRAAGIDLTDAETQIHRELNERRTADGRAALEASYELDEIATYHNRHRAIAATDDSVQTPLPRDDYAEFDHRCPRAPVLRSIPVAGLAEDGDVAAYENESALAAAVAEGIARRDFGAKSRYVDWKGVGIDLHVRPDGSVYVALALC